MVCFIAMTMGMYKIPLDDIEKLVDGMGKAVFDLSILEKGYELLSIFAPRKIEDIEKMISQKSAVDDFKLPPLKSAEKKAF